MKCVRCPYSLLCLGGALPHDALNSSARVCPRCLRAFFSTTTLYDADGIPRPVTRAVAFKCELRVLTHKDRNLWLVQARSLPTAATVGSVAVAVADPVTTGHMIVRECTDCAPGPVRVEIEDLDVAQQQRELEEAVPVFGLALPPRKTP